MGTGPNPEQQASDSTRDSDATPPSYRVIVKDSSDSIRCASISNNPRGRRTCINFVQGLTGADADSSSCTGRVSLRDVSSRFHATVELIYGTEDLYQSSLMGLSW